MARRVDGSDARKFDIARSGGRSKSDPDTVATNPPPSRRRLASQQKRRSKLQPQLPVSDGGLYGDSHIPTFGTWYVDGEQNYTGIFQAASQARKGEAVGGAGSRKAAPGGRDSGDLYEARHSKKRSSSWCCFRSRGA